MEEPVVHLKESLPVDWFHETAFSHMLANALKNWCDAEIGMVNAGVLLEGLEEGVVTLEIFTEFVHIQLIHAY